MQKKPNKLVAVTDIGSNSIKTTVYFVSGVTANVIYKDKFICNFTRSLLKSGKLSKAVTDKALSYLKRLKKNLSSFKDLEHYALGTSAMREAQNALSFKVKAEKILGCTISIINGRKEAELGIKALSLELGPINGLVIDLGGGSAEITLSKNSQIISMSTLKLGHQMLINKAKVQGIFGLKVYIQEELNSVKWLKILSDTTTLSSQPSLKRSTIKSLNLYLIGGRFRNLAKLKNLAISSKLKNPNFKIFKAPGLNQQAASSYCASILLEELLKFTAITSITFCKSSIREGLVAEKLKIKS